MNRFPNKRLGPADNVANDAQLMGRPKNLNNRPEGRCNHRSEGLPTRSSARFLTPAHRYDQSFHFGLQPTSGRPLRPERLAKAPPLTLTRVSDRGCSNPCSPLFSDWRDQSRLRPTDRGRPLGKGQETDGESKARHTSQNAIQGTVPCTPIG